MNADTSVKLRGIAANGLFASGLSTRTRSNGAAGDLTITTEQLLVQEEAVVSTSTSGKGKAGNLAVNASELVEVIGRSAIGLRSALTAQTAGLGDKAAGNLRINTGKLFVRDGARVSVSGQQARNAGDIQLKARSIWLDNQGALIAKTESGNGGNIRLKDLDLLVLRRTSQISTEAGTNEIAGGGNGGDITINTDLTDLLVALPSENSDIIANAFDGRGGNVRITTQGIFGIQFREKETLESDITASSRFGIDGTVQINTPDVAPSRGLVALPAELVDASSLIAQGCRADVRQGESELIVTGRGGLPPNPSEALSSDTVWTDLRPIAKLARTPSSSAVVSQPINRTAVHLVEAQGWMINNLGEVVLTATAPTVTPHIPWMTQKSCHTP